MDIFPIHVHFSEDDRRYILDQIDDKLARGLMSQAEFVDNFERAFAEYTGASYSVALSSGTAAIEIALRIRDVSGKTVLVPANTNFATAISPLRAGAHVALADIDPQTLAPSVTDLESARTVDTAGVVVVHMGGIVTPEMPKIRDWCAQQNLWLLEDCAHAHGSQLDGRHAGRFGFGGAFSFFATKVITSSEGGMLITDDAHVAEEARLFRNLGKPDMWISHHIRQGSNMRMSEFNALIGNVQLSHLDEFIEWREQVAAQYTAALSALPMLQPILPFDRCSWYKYVVLLPNGLDRTIFKAKMRARGVRMAGEIYEEPLHHQPAIAEYFVGQCFPHTEDVCARHVCLPIYYGMTDAEVAYVIKALTEVLQEA